MLALAPSATNTVEKPATNRRAAAIVSRRTVGSGSASARRSKEAPARYTRYGGTSGKTQGDRKLTRPATRAATIVTFCVMVTKCDSHADNGKSLRCAIAGK